MEISRKRVKNSGKKMEKYKNGENGEKWREKNGKKQKEMSEG